MQVTPVVHPDASNSSRDIELGPGTLRHGNEYSLYATKSDPDRDSGNASVERISPPATRPSAPCAL
jgi:hypothetical protein